MNHTPLSPDDPRLTLYALDEMEPAERAGFEKLLEQDAAARQIVAEIRATVATVTSALEHEPMDASHQPVRPAAKVLRFPQIYYMVSGLAAACFALFFVYWQQNRPMHEQMQTIELDLAKAGAAQAQAAKMQAEDAREKKDKEAAEARAAAAPVPVAVMTLAETPPPPAPSPVDEPVQLNAYRVSADANGSYAAGGTVAGTRDRAELSDMGLTASAARQAPAMRKMHLAAPRAEAEFNTEAYGYRKDNAYLRVADQPLSTFSIDVDTAAYANVRRFLAQGQRPPADAVRIEELVNYFPYHYAPPAGPAPFAASLEVASAPWAPEHRLVRIGLKGREVSDAQRPAANLVFLLDVSGSMNQPNKLPLVKQSLRLLVNKLRADDRVAIAVYAGASGLALPSTSASRKAEILDAIDRLDAGGSTNGAMGIHLAYDIAKANFVPGGVNRVILATDGDFNVGVTNEGDLTRLIEEKAKSGVFLSVLGFGMGNYKDSTLEQLADKGNGNYAYIDTLAEARKSLVEQAGGTLVTIAKDVKIQVEFNPAEVSAYRLIGYENRLLAKEDFNNDQVDAGEIGAGHTVTALYEVVPAGGELPDQTPGVDPLKYQRPAGPVLLNHAELLTVKIRYKEPASDVSTPLEFPLRDTGARFEDASADFKFAAAVAGFGMALRDSPHPGSLTLAEVADWGRAGLGDDSGGYRQEFLGLVKQAEGLVQ
jgi:Ca-activated chloride channel family protein